MSKIFKIKKINPVLIVLLLIILTNCSQLLSSKPIQTSTNESFQVVYTQDVKQFKTKRYNQRLQVVVGCWLLSKEYIQNQKSDYLFNKNPTIKEVLLLNLVKQCMKNIKRKDAVLKITALVGKNIQNTKTYQQIVKNKNIINQIFIKVNSQSMSINNDNQIIQQRQIDNNQELIVNNQNQNKQSIQKINKIQNQLSQTKNQSILKQQSHPIQQRSSEFDTFLMNLLKKYTSQFKQIQSAKDGIKGRVEEQLKKRQKYYFGFIPATQFTHSVFLVTISLSMVFVCTCYRYYKMRSAQPKKSLNPNQQAAPQKTIKKMGSMSQITFKKKRR